MSIEMTERQVFENLATVRNVLSSVESLIMRTPTGAGRNRLCDVQIMLMQEQDDLAKQLRAFG